MDMSAESDKEESEIRLDANNAAERKTLLLVLGINFLQVIAAGLVGIIADSAGLLGAALTNDLTDATLSLRPELRGTLDLGLEAEALGAVVSGSGPTCAFLCADADAAVAVGAELSGAGVCRTVRVASGPVPGARVIDSEPEGSL